MIQANPNPYNKSPLGSNPETEDRREKDRVDKLEEKLDLSIVQIMKELKKIQGYILILMLIKINHILTKNTISEVKYILKSLIFQCQFKVAE